MRDTCVFYITATCNLKCKYCYIDKSPALQKIDALLAESFNGDYYINFMKKIFNKSDLQRIEFWGGEPSYGLIRAIPTVKEAIEYFPNLADFMMSTNLTTETCIDDLFNFWSIFKNYPYRKFHFTLQLSIDGPTYINDFNRGEKVTERFTKNFSKLVYKLQKFLKKVPNLSITAVFKETLDNYAISLLQTKESVIEYFQFLEQYKVITDNYLSNYNNFEFFPGGPNTAAPSPHSSEDGKRFGNFCKLCNEVVKENKNKKYFYYYNNIMPFTNGALHTPKTLTEGCGFCGSGDNVVGLLPNKLLSGCHNGFVELITDYKNHMPEDDDYQIDKKLFTYNNDYQKNMIFSVEDWKIYEKQVKAYCPESCFQVAEMTALILQMAEAGQIDKKYISVEEAVRGAHFIQSVTSNCMRNNLQTTGSKYIPEIGFIRLFLNGAKEEIEYNAKHF